MKIYLASRYSRAGELCIIRTALEGLGHTVTSRWIDGNHQITDQGLSDEAKASERTRFALEDWDDLMAADWVISFTEEPRKTNTRGGRHVEFGAALAAGKRVLVVGYRENVFHCLPQVEFFPTPIEMLQALGAEKAKADGVNTVLLNALQQVARSRNFIVRCEEPLQDIVRQALAHANGGA